jgi:hypothetical protein
MVAALAWPAPVAQARPAQSPVSAAAAASPTPSGLCLLGALLCGQNIIQNPSPCLLGVLLCSPLPLPTPCVGNALLCGNGILSAAPPGASPTLAGPTSGQTGTGAGAGSTGSRPGGGGTTAAAPAAAAAAPLLAPPGVGLVPPVPAAGSAAAAGPNPDALAVLLSLSIRDGLSTGSFSVWPWLAGVQVALLMALLAAACSRQLTPAAKPRG